MTRPARVLVLLVALSAWLAAEAALAKPPRREPKRLSSVGDSITAAVNADEPFQLLDGNPWASWANGYVGKWEKLLGRTDVNSHNQRITKQYGKKKRKNHMEAKAGADSDDLLKQMTKAVKHKADYVTVFMGHNDVCDDDFAGIPSDAEFETNLRAGFEVLRAGLPPGATVYTLAIVDIYRLWEIGDELDFLGIFDCRDVWESVLSDLVPCATMLDPDNDEADRQFTRGRILAFNAILADVVAEYEASDENHHWHYDAQSFEVPFEADEVSLFDCFHPSAEGQERLAEDTWGAGPFAQ
jgi:lysophospholipase L1-like esterase